MLAFPALLTAMRSQGSLLFHSTIQSSYLLHRGEWIQHVNMALQA